MTPHTCREYDPTCYRCDLDRDEELHACAETCREHGYRVVKLETMYGGPEQRYVITEELL